MIVLFWRGFGIMVILLTAASELIAMGVAAAAGANVSTGGKAYNGYGLILAAIVVSVFYHFYLRPKRIKQLRQAGTTPSDRQLWAQDSIVWIPFALWPGILLVGGIIVTIINLMQR